VVEPDATGLQLNDGGATLTVGGRRRDHEQCTILELEMRADVFGKVFLVGGVASLVLDDKARVEATLFAALRVRVHDGLSASIVRADSELFGIAAQHELAATRQCFELGLDVLFERVAGDSLADRQQKDAVVGQEVESRHGDGSEHLRLACACLGVGSHGSALNTLRSVHECF
jgi:hypothetical protein